MKKQLATLLFSVTLVSLFAQNWQPMAVGLLPDNYVIFSISAVGDHVVWAVASGEYYSAPIPASNPPYMLRTSDGGQNWTVAAIEEAAGTISFQIVAVDSLTAWITTQDYGGGPGRALYQTTDGGIVWTKKLSNDAAGVALNRFPDGQHWLAHNRQGISRSSNNGTNWSNSSISGYQANEYQILHSGANMSCTVGDTLWNGTSSGRIVRFTNFGQSSQFFNTPLGTATVISSIAFQDHAKGLCYSRNFANNHRIARSVDGGATWAVLAQQPDNTIGWNITAVPGAPGFYVLASNYNHDLGKVAITTNSGDSWTVQNLNQSLNAVAFTSPTTGWIGAGRVTSVTQPSTQPLLYKYTGAPLVGTETPAELPGFSVSPNPVTDVVRFDFDGFSAAKSVFATLTDVSGHSVFSGKISDKQLEVSHLASGVYFLTIETEQGVAVRKIVRE
ncbi:MAG TPA: T9SS type A sorting domain-containing protein [Saprospiraceae bacterium]|nr:T9SS type A sorting domain-containing protein [Saprospiraceae bacterium]